MKRVLCPRCDGYVAFDERRCCAGESLFLVCSHCGKSFSLSYEDALIPLGGIWDIWLEALPTTVSAIALRFLCCPYTLSLLV